MLLARPLCQILELIVARESKSFPTPGIDSKINMNNIIIFSGWGEDYVTSRGAEVVQIQYKRE